MRVRVAILVLAVALPTRLLAGCGGAEEPREDEPPSPPEGSAILRQNSPNPFRDVTLIPYSLSREAHVTIKVYNILGHEVATVLDAPQPQGDHLVDWDGTGEDGQRLSAGTYFYELEADGTRQVRRMVLLPA